MVTIVAHRSEMGTGIRTGLPMVLADELEADWSRVKVVAGSGRSEIRRSEHRRLTQHRGNSISRCVWPARSAGRCSKRGGAYMGRRCQRLPRTQSHGRPYADRPAGSRSAISPRSPARCRCRRPIIWSCASSGPSDAATSASPFRLSISRTSSAARPTYGIDVVLPGMKYASIERCPVYGGKVESFDANDALKVPGVEQVVEIPADANSVRLQAARRHRGHRQPTPGRRSRAGRSSRSSGISGPTRATTRRPIARSSRRPPSGPAHACAARATSTTRLPRRRGASRRNISSPTTRTPRWRCRTRWHDSSDDTCETWAPDPEPAGCPHDRRRGAGPAGDQRDRQRDLAGRRFRPQVEARLRRRGCAAVAQSSARPVKVTWTREDEIRHDYYHAIAAQHLEAGLDADGRPTAWLHRTVFPGDRGDIPAERHLWQCRRAAAGRHRHALRTSPTCAARTAPPPTMSASAGIARSTTSSTPSRCARSPTSSRMRPARTRSSICVSCSAIHASSISPQCMSTIRTTARRSTPIRSTPAGCAVCSISWPQQRLGPAAAAAAGPRRRGAPQLPHLRGGVVARGGRQRRARSAIPRIDIAIDCGLVVNPDRVRAQLEGAAIMGISNALYSNITIKQGRIEQSNFGDYLVARTDITPQTHVHIVDSEAPPGGVGEPGVPPDRAGDLQRDLRRDRQAYSRPARRSSSAEGLTSRGQHTEEGQETMISEIKPNKAEMEYLAAPAQGFARSRSAHGRSADGCGAEPTKQTRSAPFMRPSIAASR